MDEDRRKKREERRRRRKEEAEAATEPTADQAEPEPEPDVEDDKKKRREQRRERRRQKEEESPTTPTARGRASPTRTPRTPPAYSQPQKVAPMQEERPDDDDLAASLPSHVMEQTCPGPSAPQSHWLVEGQSGGEFRRVAVDSKHARAIEAERTHSPTPQTPKKPDTPVAVEKHVEWGGHADEEDLELPDDPYRHFAEVTSGFLYAVFLFAQGLAGGFALLHVFVTFMPDDQAFLRYYSALAADSQMTFLILLTLGAAGAMVVLSDSRAAAAAGPSRAEMIQHGGLAPAAARIRQLLLLDSAVAVLYTLALLFSVINAPIDDRISRLHNNNPTWYQQGVPNDINLSLWHVDNGIRWGLCLLAWLLVSYRSRSHPPPQAFTGMADTAAGKVPPSGARVRVGVSVA